MSIEMQPLGETALTVCQTYLVLFELLRQHNERAPSEEISGLLGGLSLLPDGKPADEAKLVEFKKAVAAVFAAEATESGYREADFTLDAGGPA